jgi:hypothetical protein
MKKIKELVSQAFAYIKGKWYHFKPEVRSSIHLGVEIVERIKNIEENPLVDVLTQIIPGETDDAIKNILRTFVPVVLIELKLVDACADEKDPAKLVICASKVFTQVTNDWVKDGITASDMTNLAAFIAMRAEDGLQWTDAYMGGKYYYDNIYSKRKK